MNVRGKAEGQWVSRFLAEWTAVGCPGAVFGCPGELWPRVWLTLDWLRAGRRLNELLGGTIRIQDRSELYQHFFHDCYSVPLDYKDVLHCWTINWMLDSEAGSGLLSGFESTLWDGGGILPSAIAIRLSPEGPIAFCSSFNTQTAGAGTRQKKSSRFGLLASGCAVGHADIFSLLENARFPPFSPWDCVYTLGQGRTLVYLARTLSVWKSNIIRYTFDSPDWDWVSFQTPTKE